MTALLIVIHVTICVGLICLVLIQRGRGSGLVESFSGVESMFGTKTNAFLSRLTTALSILFFLTCLSLAVISVRQGKSLLADRKAAAPAQPKMPPAQNLPAQPSPAMETKQPETPIKSQEVKTVPGNPEQK